MSNKLREFPSKPNAQGFFYESAEMYGFGILSGTIGNLAVKKIQTSKGTAIVKKLSALDYVTLKGGKQFKKNDVHYHLQVMATATEINGQKFPVAYYTTSLTHAELNKLMVASTELNFL
ncbi:MAG: hypothetical protein KGO81_02515 [Bacteroidota bacterium]|nr:hypothetical protein [Bacteroidota bacterium]